MTSPIGYRGRQNWRDMSEYVVHFTKAASTSSEYEVILKILWEGNIHASGPFGAARYVAQVTELQKSACFSEIPLDLLERLIARRSLYGIGFHQNFLVSAGGGRVWYLDKGGYPATALKQMITHACVGLVDVNDPLWNLTPFVDFPGALTPVKGLRPTAPLPS